VHSPNGTQQHIRIDARGQNVGQEVRASIKEKIVQKSNGLIQAINHAVALAA
jgi:hypothetical protein